jgi:hypothetical protein
MKESVGYISRRAIYMRDPWHMVRQSVNESSVDYSADILVEV